MKRKTRKKIRKILRQSEQSTLAAPGDATFLAIDVSVHAAFVFVVNMIFIFIMTLIDDAVVLHLEMNHSFLLSCTQASRRLESRHRSVWPARQGIESGEN